MPAHITENDLLTIPKAHPYKCSGAANCRFRVRLTIGYHRSNDRPASKTFYGASSGEARQKAYQYIQQAIVAGLQEQKTAELLSAAIEAYLTTERFGRSKPATYDRLEEVYRNQIAPHIEGLRIDDVTKSDCAEVIDANIRKGYSYSTIVKTYQLLRAFFSYYSAEYPNYRNPMRNYKLYSQQYIHTQQEKLRAARDAAREQQKAGKRLTAEEEALAENNLKLADTTTVEIFTDKEIERIKQTVGAGFVTTWTSKKGNPIQTKPRPFAQGELSLFLLYTTVWH